MKKTPLFLSVESEVNAINADKIMSNKILLMVLTCCIVFPK